MGKSTAAAMLRRLGVPLFDADLAVHRLLAPSGAAVAAVAAAFPDVETAAGGIDRVLLGQRVFADPAALRRLGESLHPMVAAEEKRCLARLRSRREPVALPDIPLLFESGAERRCELVRVVSAPSLVQRLAFIGSDRLVIHNSEFDLSFLNAELARLHRDPISCAFVDTLGLARVRFPGAPASLDALCRRFEIDLSDRVEHGAKIDCRLLAAVYLDLVGGRQPGLDFAMPAD